MKIEQEKINNTVILSLNGKLDSFQAETLQNKVNELLDTGNYHFIFEMNKIDYLSSAGIRVLLKLLKKCHKLGGFIKLSSLQPYPHNVLKIAGFLNIFEVFNNLQEALASEQNEQIQPVQKKNTLVSPIGVLTIGEITDSPVELQISGSINNYLKSLCTPENMRSETLSNFKYALGIGALGDKLEDNFDIMGELMIINGSVIWLPTDGHNRPDFLITSGQETQINVHTAFNLNLQGKINATLSYHSSSEDGHTLDQIYKELFKIAADNFPQYQGMIGTIMRADLAAVYGAGIKKAPILENKPENGELITHRNNIREWLDFQMDFRSEPTSALIVGIGLDMSSEKIVDGYSKAFHIKEVPHQSQYLHNHAALFEFIPERSDAETDLTGEIDSLLMEAEFLSMQHLLDNSRLKKAVIGLFCIDNIVQK